MRAAIYNRYWYSMGGGERYAGMVGQILAASGVKVDLIGHSEVDLEAISAHLALDLSQTTLRVVPDRGDEAVSEISAEYDLFVNGTYMSRVRSRAPHSAYICYFPTAFDHELNRWNRWAIKHVGPHARAYEAHHPSMTYGTGWYPPEGGRRRKWAWSNGQGILAFAPGPAMKFQLDAGRPGTTVPATVVVSGPDGEQVAQFTAGSVFSQQRILIPARKERSEYTFASSTFTPPGSDERDLGFAMSRPRILASGAPDPRQRLALRYPWLMINPTDLSFLSTYDTVIAISEYTQGWISRLWKIDSEVLYPPIQTGKVHPEPERDKVILTVGRFFPPGHGHSKRQLEMVQNFGEIVRSGQLPGWRLAVLGGCEDRLRPYLEQVQAAAEGLPVDIHPNAPRSLVESLMSRAAIYWSATGYGEDTEKRPWTNEHFGMTTAEAMVGGCVPVVIDRAGQREIVREGVDGFRWETLEQLRIRTIQVALDDPLRARLAESAVVRAATFSDEAFATRWHEIADGHDFYANRDEQ